MGFCAGINKKHPTGFRGKSHRKTTTAGTDWFNYPQSLLSAGERLSGVIIEKKNAIDLIKYHDQETALFYVDPPYLHDTRNKASSSCYSHEMSEHDHENLLKQLRIVKGHVILSGYDNDLYNDYLDSWEKCYKDVRTEKSTKKTEVLWIKRPHAIDRMKLGAYKTHKIRTDRQQQQITAAIELARKHNKKITKSYIASQVGLSREHLSRRYAHLF